MAATDLITLDELREELYPQSPAHAMHAVQFPHATIPRAAARGDSEDEALIEYVTSAIEEFCERPFIKRQYNEDYPLDQVRPYRAGSGLLIRLRKYPVASVASVTRYTWSDQDGSALDDEDYWLAEPRTGRVVVADVTLGSDFGMSELLYAYGYGSGSGQTDTLTRIPGRYKVVYTAGEWDAVSEVSPSVKIAAIKLAKAFRAGQPVMPPQVSSLLTPWRHFSIGFA